MLDFDLAHLPSEGISERDFVQRLLVLRLGERDASSVAGEVIAASGHDGEVVNAINMVVLRAVERGVALLAAAETAIFCAEFLAELVGELGESGGDRRSSSASRAGATRRGGRSLAEDAGISIAARMAVTVAVGGGLFAVLGGKGTVEGIAALDYSSDIGVVSAVVNASAVAAVELLCNLNHLLFVVHGNVSQFLLKLGVEISEGFVVTLAHVSKVGVCAGLLASVAVPVVHLAETFRSRGEGIG